MPREPDPNEVYTSITVNELSESPIEFPILKLTEYCRLTSQPRPIFEVESERRQHSEIIFVIRCSVGEINFRATATNKKMAKQSSAIATGS